MQIVSHPLLLEFKECIQTKTHIYIITELVKGKDLFEFVKDYDFLEEYDAAKIVQQLIVGVRVLHSFEIVHRDLKPENIMVEPTVTRWSSARTTKSRTSRSLTSASATTSPNSKKKLEIKVTPLINRSTGWHSQLHRS